MPDRPVACLLTAPELRERRRTVLADFRATQVEARELKAPGAEGYVFRFAPSASQLAALAELIDLERQCCPFLRFQVTVEPAGGPVWLALTGPAGTRELLAHELGFVRDPDAPAAAP
jgi:hypothetical protein